MLVDHRYAQERWAHEGRERRRMANEFGRFVANLACWAWFSTITFRRVHSAEVAIAKVTGFLTLANRASPNPVGWLIAAEIGRLAERVHCHSLVSGVQTL